MSVAPISRLKQAVAAMANDGDRPAVQPAWCRAWLDACEALRRSTAWAQRGVLQRLY